MKSYVVHRSSVSRPFWLLPRTASLLDMSRRKQSNPKPLKREDEEENSQTVEPGASMKAECGSKPCSPEPPVLAVVVATSEDGRTPSPPRVRLNVSLATDPAAVSSGGDVNSPTEGSSPSPSPASATSASHPAGIDFMALQPAFRVLAAGRLFPTLPESELGALAKPRPVRPKSEQSAVADPRAVPVYTCAPCGIRFSSASTLEAHQTYYCSHRVQTKRDSDVDEPKSPVSGEGGSSNKASRTGKQYACPHCSYSADKKVSLNRHMRMHASSPAASNGTADHVSLDRYCHECDIRFSSVKTLKAHKQHYCQAGKVTLRDKLSAPVSPGSSPRASPESQQFLVLPTDPVLIVPYSLVQSASVITGGATLPRRDQACVVLHDGTVQPMSELVPSSDEAVLRLRGERNARREAASPLDLTVRRSSDANLVIDEDEKENVFSSSPHEDIVCAPSIPALLGSDKRSPGRKSDSYSTSPSPPSPARKSPWKAANGVVCKGEGEKMEVKREPGVATPSPDQLHGAILPHANDLSIRVGSLIVGQSHADPTVPQVLVKHGVSKCQECNIVFCKVENFIAHKKHYCSSRSADSAEEGSRTSPGSKSPGSTKDSTESKSPGPVKPATLYQFICVACGIKFTALDNLTAHQAYYCPKRSETAKTIDDKRKCAKCKSVVTGEHQCVSPMAGWKCPCCDVVSPTAASAQKHMEVHTGVRAFRCTICKYKGNTLRGMRTHIRMHFDKKNLDLQEENYITCIVDDENSINGDTGIVITSPVQPPALSPVVVKEEALEDELVDVEADPLPASPKPADCGVENGGRRSNPNYCQTCDISFTYPASYRAHKQFYCSAQAGPRTPRTVTSETSTREGSVC